ncbi:hypothetical protein GALL_456920 [mine drainage metagenome]|uniref:Uncharacterized protein n=1 Tax=mine drainage metagenome TaxID=410659 RepID=A0A1J5PME9_9ZZZZ
MQLGQPHVVKQHHGGTGIERLFELRQGFHLNLDKRSARCHLGGATQHRSHATGGGNVVFLDEHSIKQTQTVVDTSANTHRIFLRQSQTGESFARVNNTGPGTGNLPHGLHIFAGFGGHGTEQLQKIKRRALSRQQRAGQPAHFKHDLIGLAAVPFRNQPVDFNCRVNLTQRRIDPGLAADAGFFARHHAGVGPASGIHQTGRQVSRTNVFVQGALDIGLRQHRHRCR